MDQLSNKILSIFVNRRVLEMNDIDISQALKEDGICCLTNEVLSQLRKLSPILFQLEKQNGPFTTVRVAPQVDICQQFLDGNCHRQLKPCDKLHICRFFSRCHKSGCGYPHDLNHGYNQQLIQQMNLQEIDDKLLIDFIRLKKRDDGGTRRRTNFRDHRSKPPDLMSLPADLETASVHSGSSESTTVSAPVKLSTVSKDDVNRQIDVVFPVKVGSSQIDEEVIELLLLPEGIHIESKINETKSRYFVRLSYQLKTLNDVEKALSKPVFPCEGVDIKLKPRKRLFDRSCFLLKTPIDRVEDKILGGRITLYAKALAINGKNLTVTDISTDTEQINLVQSENEIDFEQVFQAHKSKPTLQDRPMSVVRIYQYDTIVVRNIDEKRMIHYDDLQRIFGNCWKNIFSFKFTTGQTADVEFLTSDDLKNWLKTSDSIKDKCQITVTPVINEAKDKEESLVPPRLTTATSLPPRLNVDTTPKIDTKSDTITIQLRPEWALIAGHALFQDEFKAHIRTQLGGEVEVKNDELIYTHSDASSDNGKSFCWETLRNLNETHLKILRQNTRTVVWKRQHNRDYLVATRKNAMRTLKGKLFPRKRSPDGTQKGSQRSGSPDDQLNNIQTNLVRSSSHTSLASASTSSSISSLPTKVYRLRTPEEISMFDIDGFESRLEQYLEDTYQVTIRIEKNTNEKATLIIHIRGTNDHLNQTEDQLRKLFSSLKTEILNERQHGRWIKFDETLRILRYHFQKEGLLCTCQRATAESIKINHFDSANHEFGVDEKKIHGLIRDVFNGATVNLPTQPVSETFTTEWNNVKKQILQRDDYGKNICLFVEDKSIFLFGVRNLVKEFHETLEKLKRSFSATTLKIELNDQQIKYLNNVVKQDFAKFVKDLQSQGCEFSQARFRQQGEIVAPPHMHQKIIDDLNALAQCSSGDFEIRNAAFYALASHKFDELVKIAKPKCFIQKELKSERISIPIPRAKFTDNAQSMTPAAPVVKTVPQSLRKIHVGQSSIEVLTGDLSQQNVDVIVLSLSSEILCHAIVNAAGPTIVAEYNTRRSAGNSIFFTPNGVLPCKQILFLPMLMNSSDPNGFQASLKQFVQMAIELVAKQRMKSLAFPSIGCGKLGLDPSLVAKTMIGQTYLQLTTADSTLAVSFILMPNQQSVYDAFIVYLNSLERSVVNAPSTTPMTTRNKNEANAVFYDLKIVKITLISSNQMHIAKCKADIEDLATSILYEQTLENKRELLDWSQNAITDFYRFCLIRDVIPKIDLDQLTINLKGDKDAVHEAEKRFYESTTETFREARLRAVARGIIWSVETSPGSDDWEQYSFKNTGEIEDAFHKKQSQTSFTNEQNELCVITFDSMEEHYRDRRRRIRRSETNSSLPNHWDESSQNCKRVSLPLISQEYVEVLNQFNATMQGKYQSIITIERIQNERWYKQYAAHRDEYKKRHQKLDERQLFHGCANDAAEKIIQECFNRSFAGVNGVLFGHGVYFHADAIYSHNYAKPGSNGDRKMFLARVLIGKTTVGNPQMKVPPSGYDTTTDGQKIFVVYHDAAAYAEYLITYR